MLIFTFFLSYQHFYLTEPYFNDWRRSWMTSSNISKSSSVALFLMKLLAADLPRV